MIVLLLGAFFTEVSCWDMMQQQLSCNGFQQVAGKIGWLSRAWYYKGSLILQGWLDSFSYQMGAQGGIHSVSKGNESSTCLLKIALCMFLERYKHLKVYHYIIDLIRVKELVNVPWQVCLHPPICPISYFKTMLWHSITPGCLFEIINTIVEWFFFSPDRFVGWKSITNKSWTPGFVSSWSSSCPNVEGYITNSARKIWEKWQ